MHPRTNIQPLLVAIAAALNDTGLDDFDTGRIQPLVDEAVGGEVRLRVDEGGGLHDESGVRVGAIRRAPSGEWIIDGQNAGAARAASDIPSATAEQTDSADDDEQR